MSDPEEDDYQAAFAAQFGLSQGEATQRARARLAQERKAGRTAKQRSRKAQRTVPVSFRVTPKCKALIDALAQHLGEGCSQADVLHEAIEALARRHKVEAGGVS